MAVVANRVRRDQDREGRILSRMLSNVGVLS
jgi:hypothetical protein